MRSVQPIMATSYTERGNEYKKSNAGKYGAAATVGSGATIIALKSAKIPLKKVNIKNIKMDVPDFKARIKNVKFDVPAPKTMLQRMFAGIERLAVKAQINLAKPAKKTAEKVAKSEVFANAWKSVKNFTTNAGRKAADVAIETGKTLKTPKAIKAAKYAGLAAGILALGVAADYAFNKISAHRADK